MKKPKIRFIPYEGFAVKKSSGEFLDDDVTAEAYEEMIDSLIDIVYQIEESINHDKYDVISMLDLDQAKEALKKAGVE